MPNCGGRAIVRPTKIRNPSTDELALLAHFGDSEASAILWDRYYEIALKMARSKFRYSHIDPEDLANSAVLHFPKIVGRYKPSKGKFDRYVKIQLYRACQDELRKDDPLGVQIPQRSHYPTWTHLSSFDSTDTAALIEDGLARIEKGYENVSHDGNCPGPSDGDVHASR